MNYDRDEIIIKNELDSIKTPEYDIISEVEKQIKKQKSPMSFKRRISVALVVCLCFMLSVGVMGADIPSFNNLLSIINSDMALLLQPVEISCENNGIRMEVVAAMNDDDMAVIYLTMQDLEGDRIDETLDIYNYSLTGTRMHNCQVVDFDEITKTATLRMQANSGKKLNSKKVSFQINSFLSDKLIFDEVETGIRLADVIEIKDLQTIPLDMNNDSSGGSGELFKELKSKNIIKVLKNDQMHLTLPKVDFMYISNIGFIDDNLHIQTKWIGDGVDDHGYLHFEDALGNRIDLKSSTVSFGIDKLGNTKYGHDCIEYIYNVNDLNLDELKLMGYFVSNGNYVTGNWETTFKLQSVEEKLQTDCNIKIGNLNINDIKLSPLGVSLIGSEENKVIQEMKDLQKINVSANMTDGSIQTFELPMSFGVNGEFKIKYITSLPLDISKVKSVSINGTVINF